MLQIGLIQKISMFTFEMEDESRTKKQSIGQFKMSWLVLKSIIEPL